MTIEDIVAKVQWQLSNKANDRPILIMVAGGSATGKSSQVLPQILNAFGDKAVLVEQDWYQLGIHFNEKDTSPYKWDDPRNFQVGLFARSLAELQKGNTITAPSFDVVALDSASTRHIAPRPVIVVDGIYALYGELEKLADYRIYVTMPLYGRFIRRLFRMIYDQKQDKPQTAFKHVYGSVLRAHQDFVSTQALSADCIVDIPYSFADTITRYHLEPQDIVVSKRAVTLFSHDDLHFLMDLEPGGCRFHITYKGLPYYSFHIEDEYMPLLDNVKLSESR